MQNYKNIYFVKTKRVPLTPVTYAQDTPNLYKSSSFPTPYKFHQAFPTPLSFDYNFTSSISQDAYYLLALWHARGAHISINQVLTPKHPKPTAEWRYSFQKTPNKNYSQAFLKNATPEQLYDKGQDLIQRVYTVSQVSYPALDISFRTIYETLVELLKPAFKAFSPITTKTCPTSAHAQQKYYHFKNYVLKRIQCPSEKIVKEFWDEYFVQRELDLLERNYIHYTSQNYAPDPEDILDFVTFYAPIFDITLPLTECLKYSPYKTSHGYALSAQLTTSETFDLRTNNYAGNDNQDTAPINLRRDSKPTPLALSYEALKQAYEEIKFLLTLPLEDQITFASDSYDYCFHCQKWFPNAEPCDCERTPSRQERIEQLVALPFDPFEYMDSFA